MFSFGSSGLRLAAPDDGPAPHLITHLQKASNYIDRSAGVRLEISRADWVTTSNGLKQWVPPEHPPDPPDPPQVHPSTADHVTCLLAPVHPIYGCTQRRGWMTPSFYCLQTMNDHFLSIITFCKMSFAKFTFCEHRRYPQIIMILNCFVFKESVLCNALFRVPHSIVFLI